jgi:glycosyltransferase involved in cell wall biosynthesis
MRVGIATEETWRFLSEIYEDFLYHYDTNVFRRRTFNWPIFRNRINQYLFTADLQAFMRTNDVVFFEWSSGLLSAATRLRKQSAIVTRLHRYEMYRWVDRINWEVVDKVILVSQAKKQEFMQRFPDHGQKAVVIPVGVDINKFKPTPKSFNGDIGILCDLSPRKRVYELILLFGELIQKNNRLHLHIGGGIRDLHVDYYLAICNLIKDLNLQDKVILYGHVSDAANWYRDVDIFISNSYSEGLQVALMEAMASGCYCLAHRWKGADELLPDANLYFTNRELEEEILDYCELPEEEKKQRRNGLRSVSCEKLDINLIKAQIRQVIEDL